MPTFSSQPFFLPYQKHWIEDTSRLKILQKSRQVGMTLATAYQATRRHLLEESPQDTWVSSRDEQQAELFLKDCLKVADILHPRKQLRHTRGTISFPNISTLFATSSSPNAQAGKRGHRILDEFALHQDPEKLYAIAYPGITWGGSLSILSTHRGRHNYFHTLLEEIQEKGNPKGFSLHTVTLQDALEQGFLKALKSKLPPQDLRCHMDEATYYDFIKNGCPSPEIFAQEYLCEALDDAACLLNYTLIDNCTYTASEADNYHLKLPSSKLKGQNPLYLGVDIGRKHDATVFYLVEKVDDQILTRHISVLKESTFKEQENLLFRLLAAPALRACCMDATGIGMHLAERAVERFGKYKVIALHFTRQLKESLAFRVLEALENGQLRLPNSPVLQDDLMSVRRVFTSKGSLSFEAKKGENGHADRFWALALALKAEGQRTCALPLPASSPIFRPPTSKTLQL